MNVDDWLWSHPWVIVAMVVVVVADKFLKFRRFAKQAFSLVRFWFRKNP